MFCIPRYCYVWRKCEEKELICIINGNPWSKCHVSTTTVTTTTTCASYLSTGFPSYVFSNMSLAQMMALPVCLAFYIFSNKNLLMHESAPLHQGCEFDPIQPYQDA